MKRIKLGLLLFALAGSAHAAKFSVELTTPSTNTDNSPLTNLASIEIEWGTCNGAQFGTRQSGQIIPFTQIGTVMKTFAYPSGLTRVCIRAFAYNSAGVKSDSSNVAIKDLLPKPGKPVTLDQPIILTFNLE